MVQNKILKDFEMITEIIGEYKQKKKKGWGKLKGHSCELLLKEYLETYVPYVSLYKIETNSFIEGFSNEFDILVLKKEAQPCNKYMNIFSPKDVKIVVEVKSRGVYGNFETISRSFNKLKQVYKEMEELGIYCLYFTFQERFRVKRVDAINYLKVTKDALSPYEVFCLRHSGKNREHILGEWNRFSTILAAELKKRAEPIYKEACEDYKPDKIKVLFIAESPPFQKEKQKLRYFYFKDVTQFDSLFKNIMEVIFPNEKNRDKGALLDKFRENCFFLIDACEYPINQHEDIIRKHHILIKENLLNLKEKIETLTDAETKIILIKKNIFQLLCVDQNLNQEYNIINREYLVFPSHKNNILTFKKQLKEMLASSQEIR